ncbi:hypothetical protein BDQ17DRAFT_1404643 [Cyathus striatus]|nr:hypothetical protein BDQ17DRAFT_1404643 [Cyathus striatus]
MALMQGIRHLLCLMLCPSRTLDARNDIYDYQCNDHLFHDILEERGSDDDVELDSVIYSLKEEDFDLTYSPPTRAYKRRYRRIRCLIALIIEKCRYRQRKSVVTRPASRLSIDISS